MKTADSALPLPWVRLSEGEARDHRVIRVRELKVKDPRNAEVHSRVVIDASDWVNVIAVTEANTLVLVRQFRFGVWANTLEIPGGVVELNEAPASAAARELEEETGYRPDRIVSLGCCHPNPALQNNRAHSFLALGCKRVDSPLRPDASEDLQLVEVERAAIPGLIREGHITHSLTLVAFFLEQQLPRQIVDR